MRSSVLNPNDHAIWLDVKVIYGQPAPGHQQGQGTLRNFRKHAEDQTQKGTGTARAGDIKSPLFRGGGRVFGPRPRDYEFKLNKKLKKAGPKISADI